MARAGFVFRFLGPCAVAAFITSLAACGGGDGAYSGPVWVETDIAVADIDADGRADVTTLAMLMGGGRKGYLRVYRQTGPEVFGPPVETVFGTYPWRFSVGDLNGDNRPDVVAADVDAGTTWLLTQDPARPAQFAAAQGLFSGGYNNDAVIADLNHDGLTDVAISGPKSSVRLRLQKATSRGSFGPEVSISLPGGVSQLAAGDVDGDGRADLLTWVYTSGSDYMPRGGLAVLFQQPDGSFVVSGVLGPQIGVNIERLAIADADGDGRRDLLAYLTPWSTDYGAGLLVVPQIAPRLFGTPVYTPLGAIQGIDDAAFSDLNGDGLPDVVVAGFWPESGGPLRAPNVRSRANLMFNNGSGGFVLSATADMPIVVGRVASGDVNGDGRNDIVLSGDEACVVLYQSEAAGVFRAPRTLP